MIIKATAESVKVKKFLNSLKELSKTLAAYHIYEVQNNAPGSSGQLQTDYEQAIFDFGEIMFEHLLDFTKEYLEQRFYLYNIYSKPFTTPVYNGSQSIEVFYEFDDSTDGRLNDKPILTIKKFVETAQVILLNSKGITCGYTPMGSADNLYDFWAGFKNITEDVTETNKIPAIANEYVDNYFNMYACGLIDFVEYLCNKVNYSFFENNYIKNLKENVTQLQQEVQTLNGRMDRVIEAVSEITDKEAISTKLQEDVQFIKEVWEEFMRNYKP